MGSGKSDITPGLAGAYRLYLCPRFQPGWTRARHWELGWCYQAMGHRARHTALDELVSRLHRARGVHLRWTRARDPYGAHRSGACHEVEPRWEHNCQLWL